MEMPGWVTARGFKEKKTRLCQGSGVRKHAPSARCFGFLSGHGCSQDVEGWVCAVYGAVGIPTTSPRAARLRGPLRKDTEALVCPVLALRSSGMC